MAERPISYSFIFVSDDLTLKVIETWEEQNGVLVKLGQTEHYNAYNVEYDSLLLKGQRNEMRYIRDDRLVTTTSTIADGNVFTTLVRRETYNTGARVAGAVLSGNWPGAAYAQSINEVVVFPEHITAYTNNAMYYYNETPSVTSLCRNPNAKNVGDVRGGAASPDGYMIARCGRQVLNEPQATNVIWDATTGIVNNAPINWENTGVGLPGITDETVEAMSFNPGSNRLVGITSDGEVIIWAVAWNGPYSVINRHPLPDKPLGVAWRFAWNRSGTRLAISFQQDASTYGTVIYNYNGAGLSTNHVVSGNFGRHMDFTYDRKYLIDCWNRRALSANENGTYSENNTLLSNLTTGGTYYGQAFSPDAKPPLTRTSVYPEGVKSYIQGNLNMRGLKVMLVGSTFTFDKTAVDMTGITPHELHGPGWEQGGKALTGYTEVEGEGYFGFDFDDITTDLFDAFAVKGLVVYDPVAGKPLLVNLFDQVVDVPGGQTFTFQITGQGLLLIGY